MDRHGKCPIIYVDDSPDDQFLFQASALRTAPHIPIQPFFDHELALAWLRAEHPFSDRFVYPRPALLLCDYDLGRIKGDEVVSAVRSIPSCHDLPLVIFSGSTSETIVKKCYQAGADHFLSKPGLPARLDVIVQTLDACISGAKPFASLTALPEHQPKPSSFPYPSADSRMVA